VRLIGLLQLHVDVGDEPGGVGEQLVAVAVMSLLFSISRTEQVVVRGDCW
jgi:hypothetical protein